MIQWVKSLLPAYQLQDLSLIFGTCMKERKSHPSPIVVTLGLHMGTLTMCMPMHRCTHKNVKKMVLDIVSTS